MSRYIKYMMLMLVTIASISMTHAQTFEARQNNKGFFGILLVRPNGDTDWTAKPEFDSICPAHDGTFYACKKGWWAVVSVRGEVVFPKQLKSREELDLLYKRKFVEFVDKYVDDKLRPWLKRGAYEKMAEYQERVNDSTKAMKIEYHTGIAKDICLKLVKNKEVKYFLNDYDPDNETYLINSDDFGDIVVAVPLENAPMFREKWDKIKAVSEVNYDVWPPRLEAVDFKMKKKVWASYRHDRRSEVVWNDIDAVPQDDDELLAEEPEDTLPAPAPVQPQKRLVAKCALKIPPLMANIMTQYPIKDNVNFDFVYTDLPVTYVEEEVPQGAILLAEEPKKEVIKSDVDINIPRSMTNNKNSFAIIFANENYRIEVPVQYAAHDGEVMLEYFTKTMGLPATNVHLAKDATKNDMIREIDWLRDVAKAYSGDINVYVYYAGHGMPSEADGKAFLVPSDGTSNNLRTLYALSDFYEELNSMEANSTVVFMDACFSGSQRGDGMLMSARGISLVPKKEKAEGKMIVLSASTDSETAWPYNEKGHGLFTYFLLKKLQQTKGQVTMGQLSDYITAEVSKHSIVNNSKSQTPTIIVSPVYGENWSNLNLNVSNLRQILQAAEEEEEINPFEYE